MPPLPPHWANPAPHTKAVKHEQTTLSVSNSPNRYQISPPSRPEAEDTANALSHNSPSKAASQSSLVVLAV